MAIWGNILIGKSFKTSFLMVFHVYLWFVPQISRNEWIFENIGRKWSNFREKGVPELKSLKTHKRIGFFCLKA